MPSMNTEALFTTFLSTCKSVTPKHFADIKGLRGRIQHNESAMSAIQTNPSYKKRIGRTTSDCPKRSQYIDNLLARGVVGDKRELLIFEQIADFEEQL